MNFPMISWCFMTREFVSALYEETYTLYFNHVCWSMMEPGDDVREWPGGIRMNEMESLSRLERTHSKLYFKGDEISV